MERGEKARDGIDARDGPPDQMATDNKISPSGRRARLHRAAPCTVHHPILAGQISQQRRSLHPHTRGNATVGPLPSNRFYKTWEKVQLTSIHSFLQNEIGFIQSQLFSLII